MSDADFWEALDGFVSESRLVIDRLLGSAHPRYPQKIYPLDYGYLEGTVSGDGDGIDVWRGSRPEQRVNGLLLTVDADKRDAEIKLLLGCTLEEMQQAVHFSAQGAMQARLLPRYGGLDWLALRRSVRRFTPEPVAPEVLQRLIAAAACAPSAHNRQPWRFAALTGAAPKQRLAQAMAVEFERDLAADGLAASEVLARVQRARQRVLQAPAVVVLSYDPSEMDVYPDEKRQAAERLMGVQSVAMAGQNLLLAAAAEGLGAVWVCAPLFAPQAVRQSLDLPAGWEPQGLVLLGHPAAAPRPRLQKELPEIVRFFGEDG